MTTTDRGRTRTSVRTAPAITPATATPRTIRTGRAERGTLFLRRLVHAVPAAGRRALPELGDPLREQVVQAGNPERGVEVASGGERRFGPVPLAGPIGFEHRGVRLRQPLEARLGAYRFVAEQREQL